MARLRLNVGDKKDIAIDGVIKQAEILDRDGMNLTIKTRKGGRGAFSKPFQINSRKFWEMVDAVT